MPVICRLVGEDWGKVYAEDCEKCPCSNQGCPIFQLIRRVKRLEEVLNMLEEASP